jgi:uncharacterized membrane protein
MFAKIRPQIFITILFLGMIAGYALNVGSTEVATGAMGGMIALGMSILEKENGD